MQRNKKVLALLVALIMVLSLVPAVSLAGDPADDQTTVYVTKGKTVDVTALIGIDSESASWESSNAEVATVENGVVTGVSEGEAKITATVEESTASVNVKVVGTAPTKNEDGWWEIYTPRTYAVALHRVHSMGLFRRLQLQCKIDGGYRPYHSG